MPFAPRAYTVDGFDGDVSDVARRCRVGQEFCAWANVDLGELVEHFGRSALGDAGASVDHEVVVQCVGLTSSFYGERDTGIATDIFEFLMVGDMSADDLVTVEADPDDGDLRTAILVEGDEMREMAGGEGLPN